MKFIRRCFSAALSPTLLKAEAITSPPHRQPTPSWYPFAPSRRHRHDTLPSKASCGNLTQRCCLYRSQISGIIPYIYVHIYAICISTIVPILRFRDISNSTHERRLACQRGYSVCTSPFSGWQTGVQLSYRSASGAGNQYLPMSKARLIFSANGLETKTVFPNLLLPMFVLKFVSDNIFLKLSCDNLVLKFVSANHFLEICIWQFQLERCACELTSRPNKLLG